MTNDFRIVGKYKPEWSEMLELKLKEQKIYMADGLKIHVARRHPDCLKYLELIPDNYQKP